MNKVKSPTKPGSRAVP